jgi:hypothetical protein
MTWVLWTALALAALPTAMIVCNLVIFRAVAPATRSSVAATLVEKISVLIPARDEQRNIRTAVESALASDHPNFEVIVLDDASGDATASIVEGLARDDPRLSLIRGLPLPGGLCGKPYACAQLADAADGDVLIFVDADVRLSPDAIRRLALELELDRGGASMLSGVPLQLTQSAGEKLIVPLIHFVLLGYLPLAAMRASTLPALGAACGQLVAVSRTEYFRTGGHRSIPTSMHDGLALARQFRRNGLRTDVADVTDIAVCRMYQDWRGVLGGFAKNAHEGLGSRLGILPWSLLLLGGQSLPLFVLPWLREPSQVLPAAAGVVLAYGGRALIAWRFERSWLGAALHPAGIAMLVAIQWYALLRRVCGKPIPWKNRASALDAP